VITSGRRYSGRNKKGEKRSCTGIQRYMSGFVLKLPSRRRGLFCHHIRPQKAPTEIQQTAIVERDLSVPAAILTPSCHPTRVSESESLALQNRTIERATKGHVCQVEFPESRAEPTRPLQHGRSLIVDSTSTGLDRKVISSLNKQANCNHGAEPSFRYVLLYKTVVASGSVVVWDKQ